MQTMKTQQDVVTVAENLLAYLKGNPSCWNKIKNETDYSGPEIAGAMGLLNGFGEIITRRDNENAPWYAPTGVRHLYEINPEGIEILERFVEAAKTGQIKNR